MFSNTLFAGYVSQQGKKMSQAYATSFGWARAHPMKCKGGAHETLSLVFQSTGVPLIMVTNDSKEQTKREFDANSRRLTATHECLNQILCSSKLLKAAFVN